MMEIFAHKEASEKIGPVQLFSFKEAEKQNWTIKKDAKAISTEAYKSIKKTDQEKSAKPVLFNRPLFTLKDLQGVHVLPYPEVKIDALKAIKNVLENTGTDLVLENGLQKPYYSPRHNEIHIAPIKDGKKDEFANDILPYVAQSAADKALNKPLTAKYGTVVYVKNKFILELIAMQLAMRTKSSYKPMLNDFEHKQIAGLIEKYPSQLMDMSITANKIVSYVMKNAKDKSKIKESTTKKEKDKTTEKSQGFAR